LLIYTVMNHIREYHDMSPQGCRMSTQGQMTEKLRGQVLDDFTPGEVMSIALSLMSSGMVGEVREYSVQSDYFRRRYKNDPMHLRTTDVPGLNEWSRDDDTPANNVYFSETRGQRQFVGNRSIDIWKTTDDYYWVHYNHGEVWMCDGLDSLKGLLRMRR